MKNFILLLCITNLLFAEENNTPKKFDKNKTHIGILSITQYIDSANEYVIDIRKFFKEPLIKGVLLHINSRGGSPGSSYMIFNEIRKLNAYKPVIALIEENGTSGAYLVATGAQKIIATPLSTIGSIGWSYSWMTYEKPKTKTNEFEAYEQPYYFFEGKYKHLCNPYITPTNSDKAYIQQYLKTGYKQFCEIVAKQRNLSLDKRDQWAEGQIFLGPEALKRKLVDLLGSFSDALEALTTSVFGSKSFKPIEFVDPKELSL